MPCPLMAVGQLRGKGEEGEEKMKSRAMGQLRGRGKRERRS